MADIYGTPNDDVLNGTTTDDFMFGNAGNDTINGNAGNDLIDGGFGSDVLTGGAGADLINASEGDDVIYADALDTHVRGDAGHDVVYIEGAVGVNWILENFYYTGIEEVHGTSGNDWFNNYGTSDLAMYGEGGDDTLIGNLGNQVLDGGTGNDNLVGWSGDDVLLGRDGNDLLSGDEGSDTLTGGAGADLINGGDGNDVIYADVEDTHVRGDAGYDIAYVEGVAGVTWFLGSFTHNGLEEVHGSSGNDSFIAWESSDIRLYGEAGADDLSGSIGNDVLGGGRENDFLAGAAGNDTYVFNLGDGADTIQDNSVVGEENRLRFGAGITWQDLTFTQEIGALRINVGASGDSIRLLNFNAANQTVVKTIEFSDGSTANLLDLINSPGNLNQITGTPMNDYLNGTSQGDEIHGLGGNDQLYGFDGNDILLGGAGNDSLSGDVGNDVFNGGVGNDLLQDFSGSDTYVFGVGSGTDTVQDWGAVNDVDTVSVMSGVTPATLLITQDFGQNFGVMTLRLAQSDDQLIIQNFNSIEQIQFADGTVWDQAMIQARLQQGQTGTAANDYLSGFATNNYLRGEAGDDILNGNSGMDALVGGSGNDQLFGGMGNDVLNGGSGNDQLVGDSGSDTYIFGIGSGTDTVQDWGGAVTDVDTVFVTSGVTPATLLVTQDFGQNFGAVTLRLAQSDDQLVIGNSVEQIQFADGTVWDQATIQARWQLGQTGTAGNDVLYGVAVNNYLNGQGGDDSLHGSNGIDALLGGSGNDQLYGGMGDDVLNGGSGNDQLYGDMGSDTYIFGVGSGTDTVQDWGMLSEIDTVQLTSGVTPATLLITQDFAQNFGAVTLRLVHSDDQLVIGNSVEQIQFADGTVWDQTTIQARLQQGQTGTAGNDFLYSSAANNYLAGGAGDDVLNGNSGRDALMGGAGNDQLYGYSGDDVLNGGAGNDVLQDGGGSDTYVFGLGSGTDTVQDWGMIGEIDTVLVTSGVMPTTLLVTQDWATNPGGLTLRLVQSNDQLILQYSNFIEQIQFADGTVWDQAAIQARLQQVQTGTAGNDFLGGGFQGDYLQGLGGDDSLYGYDGQDALLGGSGNDQLFGGMGDDVLNGGSGNDQLYGDMGSDTYIFGLGSGTDTVQDWGMPTETDTVVVTSGVTPATLLITQDFAQNFGAVTLRLAHSDDQLIIPNFNAIEQIQFADGTVWDAAAIQARLQQGQTGTAGTDSLSGGSQGDYLQGLGGDDFLYGGDGQDALMGGAGSDSLQGGMGDDVLNGGSGNDQLWGDSGNDTYIFGVGSGTDTVQDWGVPTETDTVFVTSGVIPATLLITQDFAQNFGAVTLRLAHSDDQLIIQNFNSIEQIQFADGTVWDTAAIQARLQQGQTGTEMNDFLFGSSLNNNYLDGRGGDDNLSGTSGQDALLGGSGNDQLYGGMGDDVLNGGSGNDQLVGDGGSDTYIFGMGSGTDTVQDWGVPTETDTVFVMSGVTPTALFVTQGGTDNPGGLILRLAHSNDQLIIQNYNSIEQIQFADGTVWDQAAIASRLQQSMTGTESDDSLWGSSESNYMQGLGGNDQLNGQAGNDVLMGGAGDDVLDGGQGDDVYDGGLGNDGMNDFQGGSDTYRWGVGSGQDVVSDLSVVPGAIDRVEVQGATPAEVTITRDLGTNPLAITLHMTGTTDTLTLNQWFDPNGQIEEIRFADGTVWDAAAVLARLESQLTGTEGNDTLYGSDLGDTIQGLGGNDQLNGQAGNDVLMGGAGDDVLDGGQGDDVYDGGLGNDGMNDFQGGSDTYRWGVGSGQDVVSDLSVVPGAIDRVEVQGATPAEVTITRDLGTNPLAITLHMTGTTDTLTLNQWFDPNGQIEEIRFADGTVWDAAAVLARLESQLTGTEGNDTLYGSELGDTISGLGGNDSLYGNDGADVLDGGTGADSMFGGSGDDTFLVDDVADVVSELMGGGNDQLYTSVSYALSGDAEIETMILTGASSINATGSSTNNTILGNSGNNTLDGGLGADSMSGGAGDDTYVVDHTDDSVSEDTGKGTDLVLASVNHTLSADVENLTLTGTAVINGTGNNLDNVLIGNSEANVLTGRAGNDTYMIGVGDSVIEQAGGGTDTVQSGIAYTLGANVENLTLTGTAVINGTGNALDNILTGNSAANTLTGGAGNDTYIVGAGDSVVEAAGGGTDTVQSALTYTLGSNVENLTLTGTSAINGTGNSLNNVLVGNSAANTLTGGAGNDTYVVGAGDTIVESSNNGTDTVQSSVTWTLGSNLENLTLLGSAAINGTGNGSANIMTGNSANNVLSAAGGADTLRGGLGNDTVNGGSGNDTYLFGRGEGQDLLQDSGGTADKILYDSGINPLDLVISRQANDLRLSIHGSSDYVTVQNWYTSSSNRTETIQAGNGQTLLSTQVDQLIQAMASFSQQTGLTWDQAIDQQPQQVQNILAASWQ